MTDTNDQTSGRFQTYTYPSFQRACAGAATTLIVLLGFLAATVENNTELAAMTLKAIYAIALSLSPWVFITIMDALAGQGWVPSKKWERNYQQSIAAMIILVVGLWVAALAKWFFDVSTILL